MRADKMRWLLSGAPVWVANSDATDLGGDLGYLVSIGFLEDMRTVGGQRQLVRTVAGDDWLKLNLANEGFAASARPAVSATASPAYDAHEDAAIKDAAFNLSEAHMMNQFAQARFWNALADVASFWVDRWRGRLAPKEEGT